MTNDKRDLLDVLKAELDFLEKGGYHHIARAPWRPQFMFQDSPTCLNSDRAQPPKPCSDCVLMQLIPEDSRSKKIPCRHIPLNEQGETIDFFYCTGTQEELETAVARWLKTTIARLEREKAEGLRDSSAFEQMKRQLAPVTAAANKEEMGRPSLKITREEGCEPPTRLEYKPGQPIESLCSAPARSVNGLQTSVRQ